MNGRLDGCAPKHKAKNETLPGLFLCLQQMAFCTCVLSFDMLIGCIRVETVGQEPYREIIESCGFKDVLKWGTMTAFLLYTRVLNEECYSLRRCFLFIMFLCKPSESLIQHWLPGCFIHVLLSDL